MIDYKKYSVVDFVGNDSFRRWVLYDTNEDKLFWENWIAENPDKSVVVTKAQYILLTENHTGNHITDREVMVELNKLGEKVPFSLHKEAKIIPFYQRQWFRIAASVVVAASLGSLLYFSDRSWAGSAGITSSSVVREKNDTATITRTNENDKQLLVTLPDGSSVLLQKQSSISYPEKFATEKRSVHLLGEAFFEVTKNPLQPFYIHTENLTAKVLGTSFTIRAYDNDKQMKVIVKTGKVTVCVNKTGQEANNGKCEKVELLANQEAVYDKVAKKIVFSAAPSSEDLNEFPIQQQIFEFRRKPIYEVLGVLEQSYGINIKPDTATMKNSRITALLTDEPLYEKLNLLCIAIDGYYEEKNGFITIYGKTAE